MVARMRLGIRDIERASVRLNLGQWTEMNGVAVLYDDFRTPAPIRSAGLSEWLTSVRTYSEFGISANI